MSIAKQIWRVFAKKSSFLEGEVLSLDEDESHFLRSVVRSQLSDFVDVCNLSGQVASARVIGLSKKELNIQIIELKTKEDVSRNIDIVVGYPKNSALEELCSHCAEIGVQTIHIVKTDKSSNKQPFREDRLQKIMIESMRISQLSYLPKLKFYLNLFDYCNKNQLDDKNLNILCDENFIYMNEFGSSNHLFNILKLKFIKNQKDKLSLFIGPEASFSVEERDFLVKEYCCISASLGNNILRVPSAVFYSLSVTSAFLSSMA